MLRQLSIRSKLLAMLLLSGILCLAATGFVADRSGSQSLRASIFDQLTTLRENKKSEIERYFRQLELQFATLAQAPTTVEAMGVLSNTFADVRGTDQPAAELVDFYKQQFLPKVSGLVGVEQEPEAYMPRDPASLRMQADYIARNSFSIDDKYKLMSAGTGTPYDAAHERLHPFFLRAAEANNLSDIMLVDARTGTVVYSVYKGIDFGSNLRDGPLAQSGAGRALAQAMRDGGIAGTVVLEDYSAYAPSYFAPAAFIAAPITREGQVLGVMISEIAQDDVAAVMTADRRWAEVGLGKTGEAFLAGSDHTMRSGSRFLYETPEAYYAALTSMGASDAEIERIRRFNSPILNQPISTRSVDEALAGRSGTELTTDYRGAEVLSSWAPIDVLGTRWAIVAKMDAAEALAPVGEFRRRVVQVAAAAATILTLFSLLWAGAFVRPIRDVLAGVNRLAKGDESTRIQVAGRDEFSDLGRAFNGMADEIAARTEKIGQKTLEYETLLRNVYPEIVADRLKLGDVTVTEVVKNVTVIVLDIEGVSALVGESSHNTLQRMNEIISDFDEAASANGIEKIRTVGETYMAACGLSAPRLDGAKRSLAFLTAAQAIIGRHGRNWKTHLSITAGLALGDVEVGLVGRQRTVYEVWGTTMLTARRLVFDASPGTVRVTKSVLDQLADAQGFKKMPAIAVQGGGQVVSWQRAVAPAAAKVVA